MKFLFLAVIATVVAASNPAAAADDFGAPFANEVPSALSDAPYVEEVSPWDVEPAAGDEMDAIDITDPAMDLPASEEAVRFNNAPQNPNSELQDDLSP